MKEATIYRLQTSDEGTLGIISAGYLLLHTLELPDRNNRPNISRIHSGSYIAKRRYSPHFKRWLFWLQDVHGRSYILMHAANFAGDVEKGWQSHLQGCIAIGKATGRANNRYGKRQAAIFNSRQAERELMEYIGEAPFKLTIKDM